MTMPVFTLKAKDQFAISAVMHYRYLCEQAGLIEQAAEVQKAIDEMVSWCADHSDQIKAPDHKHVPAGDATDG